MLLRNSTPEDERSKKEMLVKVFTISSWRLFLPESSFDLLQPLRYKLFEELVSYFAFWHLLTRAGQICCLDLNPWFLENYPYQIWQIWVLVSIIVQQDATMYSLLYFCKLLYMFRVVTPPIIRSTYNCNYSIWHWSNFEKCSVWSQIKMRGIYIYIYIHTLPFLLPSAIVRSR